MPEEPVMDRVRRSIRTYFLYLQETDRRDLRKLLRRSAVLFAIGVALLVPAIVATRRASMSGGVLAEVFAQGLTVAAWVSLWEAIANLFIEWYPHRHDIRQYGRVTDARVMFRHLIENQKRDSPSTARRARSLVLLTTFKHSNNAKPIVV